MNPTPQEDSGVTIRELSENMIERIRLQTLSDLELIAELLQKGEVDEVGDDPYVLELIERLYPGLFKCSSLPTTPELISIPIPIGTARDVAEFDSCQCKAGEIPCDSPCLYCACRTALFRATKEDCYRPET